MKARLVISVLLAFALFALPAAVRAGDGEDSDDGPPPVPPPGNWKPAGEITPPAPTAAAEEEGPLIPSPMISYGPFQLDVHGRVQAVAGLAGDDANVKSGEILSRDGFRIRRARLGVAGRVAEDWHYALELNLIDEDNGGNALIDASVKYQPFEWAWIRAGAGKPGFSRTLLTSSGDMQFMERPYWVSLERAASAGAKMLDLDHQVGLGAGGQVSLFSYEVGVFNGSPGFSRSDRNDGLLYVLRLGVGMGEMGKTEADLERGELRWKLGLNGYVNHDAQAEYRGAGVDLAVKFAGISFHAEAVWAKSIPNTASEYVDSELDKTERWGMYAQAGYLLPFEFMDLELAVRYAIMDDQVHIDDEGDQWELTAGINAYFLGDIVKLMINYARREEMHGSPIDNDMAAAMLQLKF